MEKSDSDSLEEWDVVTVSQVLLSETTTVVTDAENGLKSPTEDESQTGTPDAVSEAQEDVVVAQAENGSKVVPEQCDDDEPRSESESRGEESKASSPEPETQILVDIADESKSDDVVADELEVDPPKISVNTIEEKSTSSENERISETIQQETVQDIVCDTTVKESSPANIEPSSYQEPDTEDVVEHIVKQIDADQDLAAIDSSSSDIDIIDEVVMDESTISTSLMSSPLSLSISSSVADASSMTSAASQFVDIKHYNQEPKEEPKQESMYMGGREAEKREKAKGPDQPGTTSSQKRSKRSPSPRRRDSRQSRGTTRRSIYDYLVLLLEFFRNMSPYDWCIIGTVALSLYVTVILNQTNIFAFIQKDDAMSQMKHMIEELKYDNKILKEQMLSEIKNEKTFSSFEHQIKELKKENSKLNHMLFDVAKVLDKQKDFQEKKEAEYLAPFKKEINKLKEYINVLKIDNEELQKEMVRMRYSGSHPREREMPIKEDIQLDVESLKKWNELITLLSKELGVLAEADILKGQRSSKDSKPFWKNLLNNFKSSFNSFRKANLSEVFKEYKDAKKKIVSDFYLLVKDFFTPEENPSGGEDDSQWKTVGDFMEDLKEKWTNIKDRLYTSDLRKFFEKSPKKSDASPSEGHQSTTERVKIRTTYDRQGSHFKPDSAGTEEDTRWVFERAADREQQRESGSEEEANWFLKKGRHNPEDEGNRRL